MVLRKDSDIARLWLMVATPNLSTEFATLAQPTVSWKPLPADCVLEEEPVENTG